MKPTIMMSKLPRYTPSFLFPSEHQIRHERHPQRESATQLFCQSHKDSEACPSIHHPITPSLRTPNEGSSEALRRPLTHMRMHGHTRHGREMEALFVVVFCIQKV
mmetsp:Transcript_23032/g.45327  ORF Transcript_23032/g.45327 Transcript_23032/m.45327 type:complete len:105 (-) Transcript_23032:219-533(-)